VKHQNNFYLLNISSPKFIVNLDIAQKELPKKYTFDEYYKLALIEIKESMKSFKLIEKKDNYHIFYTKMMNVEVIQLQAYFIKGNKVYILSGST